MKYLHLLPFIPTLCFAGLFSDNDPCDNNKDEMGGSGSSEKEKHHQKLKQC